MSVNGPSSISGTHTVRAGETLWGLSERYLGDGKRYPELIRANPALNGTDATLIRPGQVLSMPTAAPEPAQEDSRPTPPPPLPSPLPPLPLPPPPAPPLAPAPAPPAASPTLPPESAAAAPTAAPPTGTEGPGAAAAAPRDAAPALTARSFVGPSGLGANTGLTGRFFVGATLREGEGSTPPSWTTIAPKPYREVFAGMSMSDVFVDAGKRLDAVQPRAVVGYSSGDGSSNFTLQAWRSLEPDLAGRTAVGAQASYADRSGDGKPRNRIDLQVSSPPSVPGGTPALAGRVERFIPLDDNVLRARATAATSGVPGQSPGGSVSVALNPQPFAGTFPSGPRGAPLKPSAEVGVTLAPAPLPGRGSRAATTIAVGAGLANPDAVMNVVVSHTRTGSAAAGADPTNQTRLAGFAMARLGQKDVGDPPTTTTAGGIDPAGMPTGRFPKGVTGTNTTAYARFTVTLADDGPARVPTASPGPDSVTLGVVHARSHGPLANVYVQGSTDVTRYAEGRSPASRVTVEGGAHLRPADSVPVTIHLSGRTNDGGQSSMSAGVVLMPDPNTALEAGGRYDFELGELQPYARIRFRL